MAIKKIKRTLLEFNVIKSSLDNLMLSTKIGVKTSLLMHRNVKALKPLMIDYDECRKVIEKQCCKVNGNGEIVYNDETKQPEFLPGKLTEFRAEIEKLNNKEVEVILEVLNIDDLPEDLGKISGNDFYQFVPALFDTVYVEGTEYKELGT